MSKAKTPVQSQVNTTAAAPDQELDQAVSAFEASLAAKASAVPDSDEVIFVDLINADTRGVLVLFPYEPTNPEPGKEYPVMKGNLDTRNVKVPVSAFMKKTDEGRYYLSLSIGRKGQEHIGGAIFRQEIQNPADGAWVFVPGKENERFGIVAKTVKVGEGDYQPVFELNFSGKRRLSGAGVPYIKGNIYPVRVELENPAAAMAGCF